MDKNSMAQAAQGLDLESRGHWTRWCDDVSVVWKPPPASMKGVIRNEKNASITSWRGTYWSWWIHMQIGMRFFECFRQWFTTRYRSKVPNSSVWLLNSTMFTSNFSPFCAKQLRGSTPPKKSSPVLFASEVRTVNFTTSVVEEPWPPATLFQKQVGPRFWKGNQVTHGFHMPCK